MSVVGEGLCENRRRGEMRRCEVGFNLGTFPHEAAPLTPREGAKLAPRGRHAPRGPMRAPQFASAPKARTRLINTTTLAIDVLYKSQKM